MTTPKITPRTRGADLLAQTLAAAGVTRIFSLSGNQIMPIYDACIDAGIRIIHTRHEAAAVFMADAHAQLTGEIGVCMVTAAPGATNALGPLFTARQSESPILFLTGDSSRAQDGKGAFQELDQVPITAPLTKLSFRATCARDIGTETARAIRTALSGRPGPVHIALPFDVIEADAAGGTLPSPQDMTRDTAALSDEDTQKIAEMIGAAKTPLILCGPVMNATRQGDLTEALAKATDAPVIAMESPRGLKDPSLGDFAIALKQADLIVCLGKPVNFTLGFGGPAVCHPDAKWVVVDVEAVERDRAALNLGSRLTLCLAADPREAAGALIDAVRKGPARTAWQKEVADRIAARVVPETDTQTITPAELCAAVQRQIDSHAPSIVICDGGEFGQWAQAGTKGTQRIINGPSGAIGGALCYGVAAGLANLKATVFALMGDGTVGFHFAEFETAARENCPFVVVIGNDECWNAEHQIQMRDYGPDRLIGCTLSGARYDLAVAALGGHGEYVTDPADLDAALTRAVNSGKVACVNVRIKGLPAPAGSAH